MAERGVEAVVDAGVVEEEAERVVGALHLGIEPRCHAVELRGELLHALQGVVDVFYGLLHVDAGKLVGKLLGIGGRAVEVREGGGHLVLHELVEACRGLLEVGRDGLGVVQRVGQCRVGQ